MQIHPKDKRRRTKRGGVLRNKSDGIGSAGVVFDHAHDLHADRNLFQLRSAGQSGLQVLEIDFHIDVYKRQDKEGADYRACANFGPLYR